MAKLSTYDSLDVDVILGAVRLDGWAPGDFMTVAKRQPDSALVIGATGEATAYPTNDNSATITLKTLASSAANDALQGFRDANKTKFGTGFFPLLIKDRRLGDVIVAGTCFVEKVADVQRGMEAGTREWTLLTHEAVIGRSPVA